MDLGFKIHGFPKNHQVYPGLPCFIHWKGVISVVREAVLSVRRDARDGLSVGEDRMTMGKGPQPMSFGAVP